MVTILALGPHMDWRTLETFVSLLTLCETAGNCHKTLITRGTNRLEKRGALTVDKGGGRGNRTTYRGLMPGPETVARRAKASATVSADGETVALPRATHATVSDGGATTKFAGRRPGTVAETVAERVAATRARERGSCVSGGSPHPESPVPNPDEREGAFRGRRPAPPVRGASATLESLTDWPDWYPLPDIERPTIELYLNGTDYQGLGRLEQMFDDLEEKRRPLDPGLRRWAKEMVERRHEHLDSSD